MQKYYPNGNLADGSNGYAYAVVDACCTSC